MPGRAGAIQTLQEMKRLIIESIHSQKPRAVAVELIRADHVADPELFVNALLNWFMVRFNVIDEFEELLQSPELLIDNIMEFGSAWGDCDDAAMLAASILASVGAITQICATFPNPDGSYAHVIVRYKFPRQSEFNDFDPTLGYKQGLPYPADVLTMDIIS